jgi:hypothetical protein
MQRGKIAIATNFFNEATLAATAPAVDFSLIPHQFSFHLTSSEAVTRLDHTVAVLEAKPLLPVEKLATVLHQQTQKMVAKSKRDNRNHPDQKVITKSKRNLENQPEDPYSLAVLIRAAIDYFFGQKRQPLPETKTPISELLPEDNPSPNFFQKVQQTFTLSRQTSPATEDPWLSWEDLYGEASPQEIPHSQTPPQSLPGASPTPTPPHKTPLGKIKQQLRRQSQSHKLLRRPRKKGSLHKIGEKSSKIQKSSQSAREVTQPEATTLAKPQPNENYTIEANPDWLETEATPLGYVKHPLERILDWLDRIMVWLEELIVKVARSLFGRSS